MDALPSHALRLVDRCRIATVDPVVILEVEAHGSRRPPDTGLRRRLRELACERRRFGYRRLFILLPREGEPSGINRIHRLYREEGLAVRKRRTRRKACGVRVPILVEAKAMLQDVLSKQGLKPGRKRELVDKVRNDWKVSIRRACSALRIDRARYVYKSKRGDQAALKNRIKDVCQTRVRYGYRPVHVWP